MTVYLTVSTWSLHQGSLHLLGLPKGYLLTILLLHSGTDLPRGGVDIHMKQLWHSSDQKLHLRRLCSLDVLGNPITKRMAVVRLAGGDASYALLCIEVDPDSELTIWCRYKASAHALLVAVQDVGSKILLDGPFPKCILEGKKTGKLLILYNGRHRTV